MYNDEFQNFLMTNYQKKIAMDIANNREEAEITHNVTPFDEQVENDMVVKVNWIKSLFFKIVHISY